MFPAAAGAPGGGCLVHGGSLDNEAGVAPPAVPAGILISAVGSSAIGAPGLVIMATTYFWTANARSFVMASCANGLKLGDELGSSQRPLFWAMVLGLAAALSAAVWMILELRYEHGALNLRLEAYSRAG